MGRIRLETDAFNVKSAIETANQDLSVLGVLFKEARFILLTSFLEYKLRYCHRVCNKVADALASHGVDCRVGTGLGHALARFGSSFCTLFGDQRFSCLQFNGILVISSKKTLVLPLRG